MAGAVIAFDCIEPAALDRIIHAAINVVLFALGGHILPTSDDDQESREVLDELINAIQDVKLPT